MALIYHITLRAQWEKALSEGVYSHPSLQKEGFIHCSEKSQIEGTLARHFQEEQEVCVLEIVQKRLKARVVKEASASGEKFPHIYGKINIDAVENLLLMMKDEDNRWQWV